MGEKITIEYDHHHGEGFVTSSVQEGHEYERYYAIIMGNFRELMDRRVENDDGKSGKLEITISD